jgi:4-hydroxybenzoate polyprenyltransferase
LQCSCLLCPILMHQIYANHFLNNKANRHNYLKPFDGYMNPIGAFFSLIRWRNLLLLLFTQWAVWRCVIVPINEWSTIPVFLNGFYFWLLALSTAFIAAAGYIINDYFDVRIDAINKPDKVIIERVIKRRWAIVAHTVLNILGLLLAAWLCYRLQNPIAMVIQLACTLLLWFYSTHLKRMFVSGNIAVAALTALTVLILAVYEPALHPYRQPLPPFISVHPFYVIVVYTYFAFMLTWMREIVKDMEDFKGDAEDGCITMPIKIGLHRAANVVMAIGILALIPLAFAAYKLLSGNMIGLGIYVVLGLIAPLTTLLFYLPTKNTQQHYAIASRWLKIIMLSGIIALIIYYFTQ